MKKLFLNISIIFIAAFFTACNNSEENADNTAADTIAVEQNTMASGSGETEEYYMVPAPDEMFEFIKDIGGTGKSTTYVNPPSNYKNYIDIKSKALNFGIYATDFLYCSTFDYGVEALQYFVNVKKLGDELGISGAISEATADRIKKNIGNNDSLSNISNIIYFSSVKDLEKSNKANVLALVITGGWIESLYLVTNMTKKFKANNSAIDRIAEQKYTLDNLIGYLKKYESDASVYEVIGHLNELQLSFAQLKEETVSGKSIVKNGKKIFGGGTKINITEKQYQAISDNVKNIRNLFTMTK
ncbi:MAG: hypothetical protein V1781_08530 [Bacteroidota bacterium]